MAPRSRHYSQMLPEAHYSSTAGMSFCDSGHLFYATKNRLTSLQRSDRGKWGSRGGVRDRLRRRPFRPPLPSIILANVRYLRNKMDQLHAKCQGERLFRDACIIALTESWLDESISDSEINLDNVLTIRADRTRQSGKERGGGLCVFINKRWCTNIKIHSVICTPDVEILTLSLRPFYLPREFPTVVFACVYCPPDANIQAAVELIAENANSMLSKYPRAPVFYMGDYNNCSLDSVLPSFHQYVHCPTRKGNVLDLCYGNVLDAFTVRAHPPLGSSDHNVLVFLPGYRQELKRIKPQVHSAPQWSADAIACLQGSLACTDWTVFNGTLDERLSVITDYIKFCISNCIPTKTYKTFPNSRPWITPQIKQKLAEKHKIFQCKDWLSLKILDRQIKNDIIKEKLKYKEKIEHEFSTMNTKQAFKKIKILTGQNGKQDHSTISNPTTFANSLNTFYSRFDITDYSAVCNELLNALPSDLPTTPPFTEVDVRQELSRCKIGKAMGPDGIPARVLKLCAMELSPVLYSIMHESYSTARWPTLWKKSTIIPLPKKPRPSELNHYRPVALTPIASKCYEKLILRTILSTVNPQLDKHQFAYKARRGTKDAVVCLLHSLLQHLEVSGNSAAVLFVDLSSAFNTIQRHQMIKKLLKLNVAPHCIHLIHSFLSNRPQAVRIGSVTSDTTITNTGAPQGCVLSPFLYTLYTNDCISPSTITTYYKYSDDTAILALLNDYTSIAAYHDTISHFTHWCTDNFLHLNFEKTKELVFNAPSLSRISIHGNMIEQVEKFKYLGLTLDNKLTFDYHIKDIHKRSQQRLHILRKLSSLYIAPHLLLLLYTSIIQPILLYCSTSFYTMLSVTNKNKLNKITHIASKIIHSPTPNISELNDRAIARLARTIITDPEHPLNFHFTLLPSGRRYRTLTWRRARFKKSFVPSAISILNRLQS